MTPLAKSITKSNLATVLSQQGKSSALDDAVRPKNGGHVEPPPQSEDGLAVSEAVYWEKYYEHPDFQYEWNNGILEEKPVSDYHNIQSYQWFLELLIEYLRVNPVANIIMAEMGFRLALPHKVSIRKPDLALILKNNPVPIMGEDRIYKGTFDLCVELLSDSTKKEVERDTVHKKQEYQQANIKEYYILHHTKTHRAFYRLGPGGIYQPIQSTSEGVIQSTVLPGFQFREVDLYRRPKLFDLVNDKVYEHFVELEYQLERQRADQAEKKLIYQQNKANQAIQLKEDKIQYLTEKLKSLGVDPDEL